MGTRDVPIPLFKNRYEYKAIVEVIPDTSSGIGASQLGTVGFRFQSVSDIVSNKRVDEEKAELLQ